MIRKSIILSFILKEVPIHVIRAFLTTFKRGNYTDSAYIEK
ncbi:hypothetical protein BCW_2688 [Bacillus cereus W]|uniref:Uncharacterized protein n=1 Tax=Bacillus cereus (strain AH820) TaxID=405535 RepID=B7JRP3_BACC0|nr:hypothetical protein BCAH820_2782 [Bacillus cereus AH820]EDX59197.1 hypothetical protein BCW_2688 [Bacillus cereus W]EEM71360.1 hypothetical protein bthur0009_25140 [Bacillus thuringiensis serovar andalousiensis BGSC 4AW1]EEM77479.1 hypothetical protein bthur0010_25320 [Bacillus thuringiensis serovar pondicheriensis BGSC 4BA1]